MFISLLQVGRLQLRIWHQAVCECEKGRNPGKLASINFQWKQDHSLPAPISRALQKWKQPQACLKGD